MALRENFMFIDKEDLIALKEFVVFAKEQNVRCFKIDEIEFHFFDKKPEQTSFTNSAVPCSSDDKMGFEQVPGFENEIPEHDKILGMSAEDARLLYSQSK